MKCKMVLGFMLAVLMNSSSEAGFLFRAAGPGGFSNSITANVGDSINLFLVEDTNLSFVANGASFLLSPVGSSGFVTPVVSTNGFILKSITAPLQFNNAFGSVSSTSLFGVQAVQVGSLTLNSFGTASFRFGDIDAGNQVAVNAGPSIDGAVFAASSTAFSITAVPEPSTIALLGLVSVGGLIARRFRRKKLITV